MSQLCDSPAWTSNPTRALSWFSRWEATEWVAMPSSGPSTACKYLGRVRLFSRAHEPRRNFTYRRCVCSGWGELRDSNDGWKYHGPNHLLWLCSIKTTGKIRHWTGYFSDLRRAAPDWTRPLFCFLSEEGQSQVHNWLMKIQAYCENIDSNHFQLQRPALGCSSRRHVCLENSLMCCGVPVSNWRCWLAAGIYSPISVGLIPWKSWYYVSILKSLFLLLVSPQLTLWH